jgi:hypothetical protein
MKSRVSQIALRIALIEEEFTQREIEEAVQLIEQRGSADALLAYLNRHHEAEAKDGSVANRNRNGRPVGDKKPQSFEALRQSEPEKFEIMSRIDHMLRTGEWLPHLEDIRRLAEQLSKDFTPRKSRREAINPLLALIAVRPLDEIKRIANDMPHISRNNAGLEYRNLARFIVSGDSSLQHNASQ